MKKIDPKELGLLVKSQEYKPFDNKWLDEAVMLLIRQRVQHCKEALDDAMAKGEAYLCNHSDSQYIIYVNGNEYGHFGVPTYNHMIDYLNGGLPYDKGIIQQALRQHLYNVRYDGFTSELETVKDLLLTHNKTRSDLENALTEMMLVL